MTYRTEGKPAPGQLVLIHGFLNTWSGELGIEDLETGRSARRWLQAAGLWDERTGPSESEMNTLREFREILRNFVLERSSKGSTDEINEISKGVGLTVVFGRNRNVRFEVAAGGMRRVVGTLIGVIAMSVADGTWARFKCCELETCGWAFYDYSRNHSGRWCSMKTCGSRHKARQYLKRKALGARS